VPSSELLGYSAAARGADHQSRRLRATPRPGRSTTVGEFVTPILSSPEARDAVREEAS
jgi:hypothetical protein